MTTVRDQILQAAGDLIEDLGYNAASLNQIVKKSGAPKGSIYYYFPNGKEEIAAEAVAAASNEIADRVSSHLGESPEPAEAIQGFLETIAHYIEISGFRAGGPLTIVASETATTSTIINQACRKAYEKMRAAFEASLLSSGLPPDAAANLSWTIMAATEGAIILSRTYHTGDPLRTTARELGNLIRSIKRRNDF